ncbi:MAG: hypothetical protein HUU01_15735 [Saprospiraceae bacterium]|nr:hypothetical protein [Saprospiraceae bacterium]
MVSATRVLDDADRKNGDVCSPTPYTLQEPAHFVKMLIPADNPLTEEGIELGRQLFYDPLLSMNGAVSCASCHLPQLGFGDGKAFSIGVNGQEGPRSSLPLANVGYYYKGLFWDGRSKSLEDQALIPVREPHEMNSDWSLVELKLRNHPKYPELFRKAFSITDRKEITRFLVAKAIAQFERTLISANAKYDQVLAGKATYTASEERGRKIFFDASDDLPKSECGHCHLDPLFTNLDFQNNGIQQVTSLEDFPDKGRGKITKIIYDNGKFRVPTLRNIELTAPYMHDGRFETLEAVLDHYASGGHLADNLNPNVRQLNFSKQDKIDLIAFLKTLTDTSFVQNPAFANPFNE